MKYMYAVHRVVEYSSAYTHRTRADLIRVVTYALEITLKWTHATQSEYETVFNTLLIYLYMYVPYCLPHWYVDDGSSGRGHVQRFSNNMFKKNEFHSIKDYTQPEDNCRQKHVLHVDDSASLIPTVPLHQGGEGGSH